MTLCVFIFLFHSSFVFSCFAFCFLMAFLQFYLFPFFHFSPKKNPCLKILFLQLVLFSFVFPRCFLSFFCSFHFSFSDFEFVLVFSLRPHLLLRQIFANTHFTGSNFDCDLSGRKIFFSNSKSLFGVATDRGARNACLRAFFM